MAFDFTTPSSHIAHALGGEPSSDVPIHEIVNAAGQQLVSMHSWRWCEDAISYLDFRANVTISGATFNASANTVTKTDAFLNYVHVDGDVFQVTGGTGAYKGYYRIVSATDDAITLQGDIAMQNTPQGEVGTFQGPDQTSSSPTDVAGVVHAQGVALPPDFAELIAYHSTSGLLQGLQMTSHGDLLQKRASAMTTPLGFHYATIVHPSSVAKDSKETSEPYPRLELWPAPSANENAALQIVYRRGWKKVFNGGDSIPIPEWTHALFLEICRAFALGWEEADVATVDQRLSLIMQGPLFASAVARDAAVQPDLGPIINGAAAIYDSSSPFQNFNSVSAPS